MVMERRAMFLQLLRQAPVGTDLEKICLCFTCPAMTARVITATTNRFYTQLWVSCHCVYTPVIAYIPYFCCV